MTEVSPEDLGEEQVVALLAKSRDVDLRTELVWRLSALSAGSASVASDKYLDITGGRVYLEQHGTTDIQDRDHGRRA